MEWQPIETAPKDGTLIDVWCVDPDEGEVFGVRLTDVAWREADDIFPHTGWMRITDDGGWDAVEKGPQCRSGLPPWEPTHWMPLPTHPRHRRRKMEPDKDCCDVWPEIAHNLRWMVFDDDKSIVTMPHLRGKDGKDYFVNNCPACGAPARNRANLLARVK